MKQIPIAMSNRHVHLSKADLLQLFGEGYELTKSKALSQPGQFAANEKVDVVGPKGTIKGIRVLGPERSNTQIEISKTDCFQLGIFPPVRDSGDIAGTPGAKIIGPKGEVEITKGVIIAARHIHMHPNDAKEFAVKDNDRVKIKVDGERGLIYDNVLIRVREDFVLEMHVDIDEGNAAAVQNGQLVELIK